MNDANKNNYFLLNRGGRWPGFQWSGLELRDDGALQLASVPVFSGLLPDALRTAPMPDRPSGIAVDPLGTIYFADTGANQVMRIDGCDGAVAQVPCMGGENGQPAQFRSPCGLLIPPNRRSLFVADSGNHRIQLFDLETNQLVDIWGPVNPGAAPQPGSLPGQFNTPWSLAGDSEGNVYVVDYGNRRVQKFNAIGDVQPSFWNNVSAAGLLQQPSNVAVYEHDGVAWILVIDNTSMKICFFHTDGQPVLDAKGQPRLVSDSRLLKPMGIAAGSHALYAGDNQSRRILRFTLGEDFEFVGEAIGYAGPVAALSLDGKGGLWVSAGGSLTPLRLETEAGYRGHGILWGGPFFVPDRPVVWRRLQAIQSPMRAGAHVDLFFCGFSKSSGPPPIPAPELDNPPAVDPNAEHPFTDTRWKSPAQGADAGDVYIGGQQADYLWVGALFSGDSTASPAVSQLRVEFDHAGYERLLPAIYRNDAACGEFLLRLLSLFESFFAGVEDSIVSLPALFDPQAAPREFLAWLAACLGLELDENWDERRQRDIIAKIFGMSGRRGTAAGLREALRLFAGVEAVIAEPILNAAWWSLPAPRAGCCDAYEQEAAVSAPPWQATENSILGCTTMLAPAQPQGAVVGSTAIVDQSDLIATEDFGAPLFTDVAYQFCVQVYRGQVMCKDVLPRVRAILDQEKPAHTTCHLCIIEPHLRVGFQCRVGIDTVVGGPPPSLALGTGQVLGEDTALAGAAISRLGIESRLGLTARLG